MVKTDAQHEIYKHEQEQQRDLEPPGPDCAKLEKPLLLVVQTLYLLLIFIPVILYSILESFFAKPKSLKGKVVLVSY